MWWTVSSAAVLSAPVVHPGEVGGVLGGHTPPRPPLPPLQALHPPEEGREAAPHTCEGLDHLTRQGQYGLLQLGSFGLNSEDWSASGEEGGRESLPGDQGSHSLHLVVGVQCGTSHPVLAACRPQ